MPKKLSDISFFELLPGSIKKDPGISAAAASLDFEIQAVNSALEVPGLLSRLDELPEEALGLLAWQFHVDFWDDNSTPEIKRGLIKDSIAWHKYKGTPWAVRQLLDKAGFSDAELIEFWQARQDYETAGGARLDGTWSLDGSHSLIAYEPITGLPYMGHWAEFCVRLNLANARWPGWEEDLYQAVNIAKPARSWPVWLLWLYLEVYAGPSFNYSLEMNKSFDLDYPWCTPQLDGSWKLGSGGYPYALDGSSINGSWALGSGTATLAYEQLKQCNIFADLTCKKEIERPARHIAARLGESRLTLNCGWQVGLNTIFPLSDLFAHKDIDTPSTLDIDSSQALHVDLDYPASPQSLDSRPRLNTWRRLNGNWALSRTLRQARLNGAWPIRCEPGIITQWSAEYMIDAETGLSVSLGRYKKLNQHWTWHLDGNWYIGARHDLDGSWALKTDNLLGGKKIGKHYQGLNGSWRLGAVDKSLGGFRLGRPGPECEVTVNIH